MANSLLGLRRLGFGGGTPFAGRGALGAGGGPAVASRGSAWPPPRIGAVWVPCVACPGIVREAELGALFDR